ncbi:sigma-70 family RNA polymerase sigma factor [Companilactobacillus ginsenosidimutans]|uniref:RNA polymerase sigma-70 region 2 domain-containing protein n=1 Tax=Companilactobacillus ginsenosidimutans TaxID=1007676 RepID=A0A0H4QFP9_9LACO|nr:sigma-70 family RNA polymerase sigma factor [Companilactobacillus ginsenosidimutans]AKP67239.1 hypothetical protein ABM34_06600 [Companilactobacillus ginsenosidimutans]
MDLQEGFTKAIENDLLIHGVLKRLHIYQTNDNYQDYVQEARIIFAESFVEYSQTDTDLDKFNVYIFQKLIWRMTDLLRKEQRFSDVHSLEVFDFERVKLDQAEFFEELDLDCLSEFEKKLFYDAFIAEISIPKLARIYGCSDRNLRYHRDAIKAKLRKLLS